MVTSAIEITPAVLIAKTPSPFPAEMMMAVGVPSVIVRVMTLSPTDASSATLPVWPVWIRTLVESVTDTV